MLYDDLDKGVREGMIRGPRTHSVASDTERVQG